MTLPIDEIRFDIISRLAPLKKAGIIVRGLPAERAQIGIPENGIITVVRLKDTFKPPTGGDVYRQNRDMKWLIDISLNSMVGTEGAETITEAFAAYLIGFKPRHCKKMHLERIEYIPGKDKAGRYVHEIEAIAPTLLNEVTEDETTDQPVLLRNVFEVIEVNGLVFDIPIVGSTDDN